MVNIIADVDWQPLTSSSYSFDVPSKQSTNVLGSPPGTPTFVLSGGVAEDADSWTIVTEESIQLGGFLSWWEGLGK